MLITRVHEWQKQKWHDRHELQHIDDWSNVHIMLYSSPVQQTKRDNGTWKITNHRYDLEHIINSL